MFRLSTILAAAALTISGVMPDTMLGTMAAAQTARLVPPDEIVIHVHKDMRDTDFVEGLVCEFGRVLVAPVSATTSDLPLPRSYLMTETQLDTRRVAASFAAATQGEGRVYRYLLLPYDLKVAGLNYVFADTIIDGPTAAIMSTIRLAPRQPGLCRASACRTSREIGSTS